MCRIQQQLEKLTPKTSMHGDHVTMWMFLVVEGVMGIDLIGLDRDLGCQPQNTRKSKRGIS